MFPKKKVMYWCGRCMRLGPQRFETPAHPGFGQALFAGNSNVGSYAVFIDYGDSPPPLETNSLTLVGAAVLLSSFIALTVLVYQRKASVSQSS